MKRRAFIISVITFLFIVGVGMWGYFSAESYLSTRFAPNSWIGDLYCTGMTVNEVNRELLKATEIPVVTIVDMDGVSHYVDLAKANFTYDFTESLRVCQKGYNEFGLLENIRSRKDIIPGEPDFTFDQRKVLEIWETLPFVTAEGTVPTYELCYSEQGYYIDSTLEGHLDTEKTFESLIQAINNREYSFHLAESGTFYDYELTTEQEEIRSVYQELLSLEQCGLVYDMGAEKHAFDEGVMAQFIAKSADNSPLRDENGSFYYDKESFDLYMESFIESYHTYGVDRPFYSSRGEYVMVPGVKYGTELDKKKEMAYAWEYVSDPDKRLLPENHVPAYKHETPVKGLNDIGDTYIEVDLTNQKLYFYKEGELLVASDVVTGNLRTKHDTPAGVNYIYGKYKNTVLRGPGYASFVRWWMPVYKGIGLHDANWRDEFGGDIYKTSGSHGCINMPDDTADIVWEYSEIGTPVVMYY